MWNMLSTELGVKISPKPKANSNLNHIPNFKPNRKMWINLDTANTMKYTQTVR